MALLDLALILSLDTRANAKYAAIAKDQLRTNCFYEVARPILGQQSPGAALVRRPGVTDFGAVYGGSGQTQYLTCPNPELGWTTPHPWVFYKDGANNIGVSDGETETGLFTSADYYPRFVGLVNISGVDTVVLQCQNTNDTEGPPSQRIWISDEINTWTEINVVDADFNALNLRGQAMFMDGFMFIATDKARIYQSALNDLTSWDTTEGSGDYLTKGITHDITQGLMAHKNQVLLAGRDTIEVFTNQGNAAGSVLQRIGFSTQSIGLAGVAGADGVLLGKTHYFAQAGDFLFFAGRFGGAASATSLVAYNGNTYEKVSKTYEDGLLSSTEIYGVYRITFLGKIGIACQLTAPGVSPHRALVFLPDVNDWFLWESTVFSTSNNGVQFLGLDGMSVHHIPVSNNYLDDGEPYTMTAQFRIPRTTDQQTSMSMCGFVADTVPDNALAVSWSDDDGNTFSTPRYISLATMRKRLYRCGTFRQRLIRVTHTGSGEVRLHRFYGEFDGGVL